MDQQRIKAFIGNHVCALDAAEYQARDCEDREREPSCREDPGHDEIERCGDEVQRIDHALPGEPVQDRAGKDRKEQLRQRVHGNVNGVEQGGL